MIRPETWSSPMQPEQLPGSLFVILTALVAALTGQWLAILVLAAGCGLGWLAYFPKPWVQFASTMAALILWCLAFAMVFHGVS